MQVARDARSAEASAALRAALDDARARMRHALETGAGGVEFYAASGQAVALRTPRSGERVKLLGVGGHSKSLKDWLIDHKIPQRWRARLPILTVDDSPVALWDGKRWHQFGADFHSNHSLMVRLRL